MQEPAAEPELAGLARRLNRPPASLREFAALDAAALRRLNTAIDAGIAARRADLESAYRRILIRPLLPLLRR